MTTIDPQSAPPDVKQWLTDVRPEVDSAIARYLDACVAPDDPGRLGEGMRYAALGPGKRLRPALAMAASEAVGGQRSAALPAAAAVEMLHAYTLVHDDLPAMDDDDMRRGRPTVHIEFGEAIAILVGDGLLTAAFAALAELGPRAGEAVAVLARRAGGAELLAGQAIDLTWSAGGHQPDFDELERLHAAKTGALFAAAVELGGIAGGASAEQRTVLARYGMAVGVAFQHADDRDDQDFAAFRQRAGERMAALTGEAEKLALGLGPEAHMLLEFARWMGSLA
ncbi:MAG: polyprenyl synthetase family protein [Myxococcota bacterium]